MNPDNNMKSTEGLQQVTRFFYLASVVKHNDLNYWNANFLTKNAMPTIEALPITKFAQNIDTKLLDSQCYSVCGASTFPSSFSGDRDAFCGTKLGKVTETRSCPFTMTEYQAGLMANEANQVITCAKEGGFLGIGGSMVCSPTAKITATASKRLTMASRLKLN